MMSCADNISAWHCYGCDLPNVVKIGVLWTRKNVIPRKALAHAVATQFDSGEEYSIIEKVSQ